MIQIEKQYLDTYTFIDLFAGLGGFRLALESLGAECVYSNEWNKQAQKVYEMNFGDIPDGDITKVDETAIPSHDILCAGFPCQAFSISGKQGGFSNLSDYLDSCVYLTSLGELLLDGSGVRERITVREVSVIFSLNFLHS